MAVFLQSCNLRCGHCHNPETWQACDGCGQCLPVCPGGALSPGPASLIHDAGRCLACDRCLEACPSHASPRARSLTVEQLLARAANWAPYLDGVTFSGGECSMQADFLLAASPRLRQLGLTVLLDSNGLMPEPVLAALAAASDGFLFDLKALDPEVHQALTGAGNGRILANLRRAAALGKVVELRLVLIPGLTDDPGLTRATAELAVDLAVPLRLIRFRPQGVRGDLAGLAASSAETFLEACHPAAGILGQALRTQA
jgi:pyruvate formate lyase activating enzyme